MSFGSFSFLCSPFARSLQTLSVSLFIVSHPLSFVKGFFKVFWSFFRFLSEALLKLPYPLVVCSGSLRLFAFASPLYRRASFAVPLLFLFLFTASLGQLRYYITSHPPLSIPFSPFSAKNVGIFRNPNLKPTWGGLFAPFEYNLEY